MTTTFLTSFTHNVVAAAEAAGAKFKADLAAAEQHFKNIEEQISSGASAVHAYEVRIVASDAQHIAGLKESISAFLDRFKGHPSAISISTVEHKPISAPSVATPAPVQVTAAPISTPVNTTPAPAPAPIPTLTEVVTPSPAATQVTGGYVLTAGVNDYAAKQKAVFIDVAQSHGIYSTEQTWVLVTGHSQQYWQEVQAAYDAGKNPTPTTFQDTWKDTIDTTTPVPKGSAQAVANVISVLPTYVEFLHNTGTPGENITAMLAQSGVSWPAGTALQ